jgi:miniconductance mechanosensitive channel
MKAKLIEQIGNWLVGLGINQDFVFTLIAIVALILIVILSFFADAIAKKIILVSLQRIIAKSKTQWDDILF